MHVSRVRALVAACVTVLVLALGVPVADAAPPDGGLPDRARSQIAALSAAKAARTPAQAKVDSTLLVAADAARARRSGAPLLSPTIKVDGSGRTRVAVRGRPTSAVAEQVRSLGGIVRSERPEAGIVSADVPVALAPALGELASVSRVSSMGAQRATADLTPPGERARSRTDKRERAQRMQRRLAATLSQVGRSPASEATAASGAVVSEGDRTQGVQQARAVRRLSGVGVTVGVLSDGVDTLAASVASGELPPDVRVLAAGDGDEGTAMLEIVHDLAPKAELAFATANDTPEDFAQHIRDLRAAGADVIVDDIIYFGESPFQDGPIAQAVTDVTRDGAVYLSSAGNEGNVDDGTSGNYEGTFHSSGRGIGKFKGVAHDFDPGPGVQEVDPTTANTTDVPAILQWADPLGGASDDYDLYALDQAGNVVAFSNDVQDGDDDPFEGFYLPDAGGPLRLAVVKFSGADRYFQLTAFRGRFADDGVLDAYVSPGVTRGHSTVPAAYSVAAVPAHDALPFELEPGDPANPSGPYPARFTKAQLSERFTSDGPRRVFFTADGTPYTPGDFTSTGGRVRSNPDLTASDGVHTSVLGFEQFFGTSAAAPHAAAIVALALSGRPGLPRAELRTALARTALDIEALGTDRDTGQGIVMAEPLLAALATRPQPYAIAGSPVVTSSTDGDAYLEPGERAQAALRVTNEGDATARAVSVRLRSATTGVTVETSSRTYGDLRPGASGTRSFTVRAVRDVPLGTQAQLSVRVAFTGAFSPRTAGGTVVVGQPSTATTNVRFTGDVAIPDGSETGVTVPLPVRGVGPVSTVRFSIDGTTCGTDPESTTVGLTHSFVADLVGTLTSPDGTTVTLFSNVGQDGHNFCQTVFADSGTTTIQAVTGDLAPFSGTWQPAESLQAFDGRGGDGTWLFRVADVVDQDLGSVRQVSIHLTGFVPAPR